MSEPTNGSVESRPTVAQDDIVTRLRKRVDRLAEDGEHHKLLLIDEAADEIERLRTELADWKRTVRALEEKIAEESDGYE